MQNITFPVGSLQLHNDPNFNYQLNRTALWGGGDVDEIRDIAGKITDTQSWESELLALGNKAENEGRMQQAIAYYRMAEFFMFDDNPNKLPTYKKAKAMFYDYHKAIFDSGKIQRDLIPYEKGFMPIWICKPESKSKGTIVFHGGFDSYMEELLYGVLYIAEQGYTVYLFEGPGQGAARREYGLSFTHEWHKPVGAVLDHFDLDYVTLVGISLGGVLAPRAVAFEKRIKRVVGWSILPNFLDVILSTRPPMIQKIARLCLKLHFKAFLKLTFKVQMRRDQMVKWGIIHGMYSFGAKSPYEYMKKADQLQIADIGSKIDQDFLLIGAEHDHFIKKELYKDEIDALTNVRSLCYRLFTEKENADTHCNVGNTKLVLDFILNWIQE